MNVMFHVDCDILPSGECIDGKKIIILRAVVIETLVINLLSFGLFKSTVLFKSF